MVKGYRGVNLPEEMVEEIERLIKRRKDLGYQSIAEFVKEAVRKRLEEIKKSELIQ